VKAIKETFQSVEYERERSYSTDWKVSIIAFTRNAHTQQIENFLEYPSQNAHTQQIGKFLEYPSEGTLILNRLESFGYSRNFPIC
jgi:hypothetical protein